MSVQFRPPKAGAPLPSTLLQVAGVDEGDVVNDSAYIYQINQDPPVVVIEPVDSLSTGGVSARALGLPAVMDRR
jgi:hypothetical protein